MRNKFFVPTVCAWLLGVAGGIGAAPEVRPADLLPPVLPWKGASESLIVPLDDPWITPSEKTGLTETPGYDETIAYLKKLDQASALISMVEFGRSAQGRPLYIVVAARNKAFTPAAARRAGRPILLAQAGIHSGEIDGKDAGLMLLRDLGLRGKSSLLEHASFVFVPVFNVDGHERASPWNRPNQRGPVRQGWRTTAQNLNLNRDYMKADAPEMVAMLRLLNEWRPTLYLDLHVTDGMDHQYDVTFGYNGDSGAFAWSPRIGHWLNAIFRPAAETELKAMGHIPGPFFERGDTVDAVEGFRVGASPPRYSDGYGDLRHLPTVLVETHSLKPYRQRVLGTYVLLEASLRTLGQAGKALQQAVAEDESARPPVIPVNEGGSAVEGTKMDYLGVAHETYVSPATGRPEIRWLGEPKVYPQIPILLEKPKVELRRPKAYWIPPTKPDVIARLKLHGVRMETLATARTTSVEMYRLVNPRPQTNSGFHPFEGRYTMTTGVKPEMRQEHFPAGSVRVPTDQPLGDLAVALLEPQCQDSFLAWGFFLEILQRTEYIEGYVVAPMAEQMLATNANLKAEFEARLAGDAKFAGDASARMRWFYEKSPFYDNRYLLYPIGIER